MKPHQFKPESPLRNLADKLTGAQGIAPRALFLIVIVRGCFLLWDSFVSERTGIAYTPSFSVRSRPTRVTRSENPEEFRRVMAVNWFYGSLWIAGGLIIYGLIRRQDRLDPTSPSFQGQKALDDLGQWLDRENDKQHRPLR